METVNTDVYSMFDGARMSKYIQQKKKNVLLFDDFIQWNYLP